METVGSWNPLTKEKVLKTERIKYWLSVGAQPSPTVFNLLVSEKIIEGKKKIDVHKKKKEKAEKPAEGAAAAAPATPAGETKPAEKTTEVAPVKETPKPQEKPAEPPKT